MAGVSSDEPKREDTREGLDDTIPASESKAPSAPDTPDHTKPSQPSPPVTPPPAERRHSSPTVPPPAGQERYERLEEIGRGGMGRVVEAFDVQLQRKVAVKEVLPKVGVASTRRFEREVALTARLEHPSIVPLYDSGTTRDGRPYYVMRKVSGRPLDELVTRSRKLDDRLALLPHVQAAIDAIAHAHSRGVIHRDLKPANILVGDLGETVVIDWGLAKVIGEDDDPASRDSLPSDSLQTQMGSVFGTPGFMAPEQARGDEMGTHGDVYALGATLYQLLAGTPPHAGNSATDVIDKTLRHHMIPLSEIAPGAPAELVTIVNKALAHDPEHRYPDAKALGDDLRRFLTGQLVAAHAYTPWQRLGRFVKRHRATLSVAALAVVALAVLAWVSVKRVLHERDAANVARAEAEAKRKETERANAELAIRHDKLLVSRARARVDVNPTEALATLKHLPASSTQIDEARAVAQAAVLRGATWAMEAPNQFTTIGEITADGRRLLQVTRDGTLIVWDLERRKRELERKFPDHSRALWIGDKLLITQPESPPAIFDHRANTLEQLSELPPISFAWASDAGDRVIYQGDTYAGLLDVATRTVTSLPIPAGEKVTQVAISPDGRYITWTAGKVTAVADAGGKEIARLEQAIRVVHSPANKVAALANDKVFELDLDEAKPAWREIVPPPMPSVHRTLDLRYRGRDLVVMTGGITFWVWTGKRVHPHGQVQSIQHGLAVVDRFVVFMTVDNKVHFIEQALQGSVQLPVNLLNPRLIARASTPRVVVIGHGIVVGWDMDNIRPKLLETESDALPDFVDDDTLLVMYGVANRWEWIDINTGHKTAIDFETFGPMFQTVVDTHGGRVLVSTHGPRGRQVHLLRKGDPKPTPIASGPDSWGALVPGNAVMFNTGDTRVMAIVGDDPPREVLTLQGIPDAAVGYGHRKLVVHTAAGELVRIDLETNAILDRTYITNSGNRILLAADSSGRVVLAEGRRVLVWAGAGVTQLAELPQRITGLAVTDGVTSATTESNEAYVLDKLEPGVEPVRVFPPGRVAPRLSGDGRLLISLGNTEQIEAVELPARTRWAVPQYYRLFGHDGAIVSPTKRRVLQRAIGRIIVWTLPLAPEEDFAQWLDEHTNATVDADGTILWPWQKPNPK